MVLPKITGSKGKDAASEMSLMFQRGLLKPGLGATHRHLSEKPGGWGDLGR